MRALRVVAHHARGDGADLLRHTIRAIGGMDAGRHADRCANTECSIDQHRSGLLFCGDCTVFGRAYNISAAHQYLLNAVGYLCSVWVCGQFTRREPAPAVGQLGHRHIGASIAIPVDAMVDPAATAGAGLYSLADARCQRQRC